MAIVVISGSLGGVVEGYWPGLLGCGFSSHMNKGLHDPIPGMRVLVCTDLSGNEPHIALGTLGSVMDSMLTPEYVREVWVQILL